MAMEYGRFGIRVNVICPGTVRTPVWQHRVDREPAILDKLTRWYPLGRVVEPIDVAKAVAFLASDDAAAITGAVLPVDCGLTAGNIVMTRELTAVQREAVHRTHGIPRRVNSGVSSCRGPGTAAQRSTLRCARDDKE
jgi:hypothetical protein